MDLRNEWGEQNFGKARNSMSLENIAASRVGGFLLSLPPIVTILLMAALIAGTVCNSGALPSYGHPDPKDLPQGLTLVRLASQHLLGVSVLLAPIAVLWATFAIVRKPLHPIDPILLMFPYLLISIVILTNPLGLSAWYFD